MAKIHKKYELYSLAQHLDIELIENENENENKNENDYHNDTIEDFINCYIDSNLHFLYEIYNSRFIIKDILKRFGESNFLSLLRYFENKNNLDCIIKNNTICDRTEFSKYQDKFILFVFTINFVTYNGLNYYIKNNEYNIFDNEFFWKKDRNENNQITKQFKNTAESLVLFISLAYSRYGIPFDIIMYILVGSPKFMFLHF